MFWYGCSSCSKDFSTIDNWIIRNSIFEDIWFSFRQYFLSFPFVFRLCPLKWRMNLTYIFPINNTEVFTHHELQKNSWFIIPNFQCRSSLLLIFVADLSWSISKIQFVFRQFHYESWKKMNHDNTKYTLLVHYIVA